MNKKLMGLAAGLVFALSASAAHALILDFNFSDQYGGTGMFQLDTSISDTNSAPVAGLFQNSVKGIEFDDPLDTKDLTETNDLDLVTGVSSTNTIFNITVSLSNPSPGITLKQWEFEFVFQGLSLVNTLSSDITDYVFIAGTATPMGCNGSCLTHTVVGGAQVLQSRSGITSMTVSEAQVPEPATLTLLGIGVAGLGFAKRRKLT